jgi:nitrate/nitrite-specific signal transduction histidine kinase
MNNATHQSVPLHISNLIVISFRFSHPLSQLTTIREKIIARGFQSFDKSDIIDELGRLQHLTGELHGEMLRLHDLLKQIK